MSVITAYKSDADGKLFEVKEEYQKHLRKLATACRRKKKMQEAKEKDDRWWSDNFWDKVRSLAQLEQAILTHAQWFGLRALAHYYAGRKKDIPIPIITRFTDFRLRWNPSVSNSHSCPHNGITNWFQRPTTNDGSPLPNGYPGWAGRIDYEVAWLAKFEGWHAGGSDLWSAVPHRFHTESGGGGGFVLNKDSKTEGVLTYGYGFHLFAADWPGLTKSYDEAWKQKEEDLVLYILHHGSQAGFTFNADKWVNARYPAEDYK